MNYIVFDLEWNQSPNGKEDSLEHLPFEIIEIGAVKLDDQLRPVDQFHRLVRPQAYRQLHYKISEVTHMNIQELREKGRPFAEVMRDFWQWCGGESCWFCTWGSMDLTELQRNVAFYGLENPFPRPLLYYDVQKLYCLQYGDGKQRVALDLAVQEQQLEEQQPFHRALADALYTGRVLSRIDMARFGVYLSVDYYQLPQTKEDEYRLHFPEYSKYVSREFDSREELMRDKSVTDVVCQSCSRMLRKKIRWFPYGQRFYLCLAVCPEHGYVKGKIRIKKSEQDRCYAVKTVKAAGEGDLALLAQKKEDGRRRRARAHSSRIR